MARVQARLPQSAPAHARALMSPQKPMRLAEPLKSATRTRRRRSCWSATTSNHIRGKAGSACCRRDCSGTSPGISARPATRGLSDSSARWPCSAAIRACWSISTGSEAGPAFRCCRSRRRSQSRPRAGEAARRRSRFDPFHAASPRLDKRRPPVCTPSWRSTVSRRVLKKSPGMSASEYSADCWGDRRSVEGCFGDRWANVP